MPDFLETWKQLLNQDLSRFADRGSETKFESDGNTLGVSWQVRGKPHDAIFSLQQGGRLRWASGPTSDAPYFAFLASEGMADLPQLASACLATMEREPDFVASDAIVDNGVESVRATLTPRALTDLSDGAREQADGSTQVFFLKGDAGAGKTTLLREATILQAERYLAGDSAFLFLYVPAQGRELSNLRDAFAGELDELRAAFTRDAIASLVRESSSPSSTALTSCSGPQDIAGRLARFRPSSANSRATGHSSCRRVRRFTTLSSSVDREAVGTRLP
jgi:hypothetical protein